jgi:thioredoxin reductase (NADPH)
MLDLVIIGGGPAGLAAAIYAARHKLEFVLVSKTSGGAAATAHKICNYPSYEAIRGGELMQRFTTHAKSLGADIRFETLEEITKKAGVFLVKTNKETYKAKKVIFTSGTERLRLNAKNEGRFLGKGVSYCAVCDAAFFRDKVVGVIGGSDAALTAALLLTEFAKKIYIIYGGDKFSRAEPTWVEIVNKNKKIQTIFNEEVVEILGEEVVEGVRLKSGKELEVGGVFVEIGKVPNTDILDKLKVKKTKTNYIVTDKAQKTNLPGFFAAGDVTNNALKQIVTASAEGAIAAHSAYKELKGEE